MCVYVYIYIGILTIQHEVKQNKIDIYIYEWHQAIAKYYLYPPSRLR